MKLHLLAVFTLMAAAGAFASDGNRLAYLHEDNPYYASQAFPRLTTEQWVGEPGVDAVVVLAVDDLMENPENFEIFLRPVIERLKKSHGKAPISIMSNRLDPKDPHAVKWLEEGLNLDTHTHTHPCPLFDRSDFKTASWTYHTCVDNISEIPGNKPVAFRMPCLDIWNTTSPRFYTEIFNQVSPKGRFLTMSSSITVVFDGSDPELPRSIVIDEEGRERFGKYMNQKGADVFGRVNYQYGNFIRNYPYPTVVSRLCWEIPMVTSDNTMAIYWGRYGNNTLRDWKSAIDATVIKKGTLALCFHTGGTSKPAEYVELVDHLESKYQRSVRFMNFREIQERLDKNLLGGHPLRAADGRDNGVRLLDLNADGFLDVVVGNDSAKLSRIWDPAQKAYREIPFPTEIVSASKGSGLDAGVRFGVLQTNGWASFIVKNERSSGLWHFTPEGWQKDDRGLSGLGDSFATLRGGADAGVRLRDLDGDGKCELIVSTPADSKIYRRTCCEWAPLSLKFPEGVSLVNEAGQDAGLRWVDVNNDRYEDLVFANEDRTAVAWLENLDRGWSKVLNQPRRANGWQLPAITRGGRNNGAWFDRERMWVVNEDTSHFRDHAQVIAFSEINEAREYSAGLQEIADWMVVGPFSNDKEAGFNTVYDPEKNPGRIQQDNRFSVLGEREGVWEHVPGVANGVGKGFSLEAFCEKRGFRKNDLVIYLHTIVRSPRAQKAKLLLGSEDSVKVWMNGELVHTNFVRRRAVAGEDRINLNLQEGDNPLLIKLEQISAGGWVLGSLALSEAPVELVTTKAGETRASLP